jgi:hypothetical protein
MTKRYDVIIIGSGSEEETLAPRRLGQSDLLLEPEPAQGTSRRPCNSLVGRGAQSRVAKPRTSNLSAISIRLAAPV